MTPLRVVSRERRKICALLWPNAERLYRVWALALPLSAASQEWADVRAMVLKRDKNKCQDCGENIAATESDVHHLVPRSAGGSDDPSNLILLCDGCHGIRHPNLHGSLARHFIERWAVRLARLVDVDNALPGEPVELGPLLRVLGKERLREGQLEVVLAALRGQSVLVVRPTGSGKSLCFQIPTLAKPGMALVIVPLKALMVDQVIGLQRSKVPATFINGDLGPTEKELRYQWVEQGIVKFAFVAPERFDPTKVRPEEVERMRAVRPNFLVVDEAHCIDRWGDAFRPIYGELGDIRHSLGNPPVLAFTATAGRAVQQRILDSLGVANAHVAVTGVDRPNIALFRVPMNDQERRLELTASLLRGAPGRTMIFVPSTRVGHEVQVGLKNQGIHLEFYHSKAGTANERNMLLGRFTGRIEPQIRTIICTSAFGMGLDVPDVRTVIHWQHPSAVEDYLQEFGRAGRDGRRSTAILFTGEGEVNRLRFMAKQTVEGSQRPNSEVEEILGRKYKQIDEMRALAADESGCFRRGIIEYFEDPRRRRRPLSVQILDWIFARSQSTERHTLCCDWCHPSARRRLLSGALPT